MRFAICDDNTAELNKYAELMGNIAQKNGLNIQIDRYNSGKSLLFNMEDHDLVPDVVFLDINMPEMNGIEVARQLQEMNINTIVVFLTISKDFYLEAFDLHAYNYIPKVDFDQARFERIFLNLTKKVRVDNEDVMVLFSFGRNVIIPIEDIWYFESNSRILTVHYKKESFDFYSTMSKVEEELSDKNFIRIHRSFLIAISAVQSYTHNSIVLKNGVDLPIGRSYYNKVKETIEKGKK